MDFTQIHQLGVVYERYREKKKKEEGSAKY
jgi:hypothetical protein